MSAEPREPLVAKAIITLDLDGVVCRPPLGLNFGIRRRLNVPPLPDQVFRCSTEKSRSFLSAFALGLRYLGRRPLDDAKEGLLGLRRFREPVLVTARGLAGLTLIHRWLARYGLRDCFAAVYANDTDLRPAQFKLHKVRLLGAHEHVDDDGSTAYYLAKNEIPRVYLRDWPRNRRLPYPPNVTVVRSLVELAELVQRDDDSPRMHLVEQLP